MEDLYHVCDTSGKKLRPVEVLPESEDTLNGW